jgi:hypothetical protein
VYSCQALPSGSSIVIGSLLTSLVAIPARGGVAVDARRAVLIEVNGRAADARLSEGSQFRDLYIEARTAGGE